MSVLHLPQTVKDILLMKTGKVQTSEWDMICFYRKAFRVYINVSLYA